MNLDDKKFAIYIPEKKVANDYLDKSNLFDEILKISKHFKKQLKNKLVQKLF